MRSHVALRHVRFTDTASLQDAIATITETRSWHGERVDALDGVAFEPGEYYLTLGRWQDEPTGTPGSDYAGQEVYWRSIQQREIDLLTTHDYLWRWDTDWFWCSRAFGAQHPLVRRVWPRRLRRSDIYHRLVGLDRRFGIMDRLDRRAGRPKRERVVQDVEVPVERLGEFLDWFDREVGMRPVWLCPLRLRDDRAWPSYPLEPGRTYVNVGFWGAVPVGEHADESPLNRAIENEVADARRPQVPLLRVLLLPGRPSTGSTTAPTWRPSSDRYDPDHRLTSLYDKAVRQR